MLRCLSPLLACAAAASLLAQEPARDWPRFRGPDGNGVVQESPKLLGKWDPKGPPLLWKSDPLPFAPTCGVGSPVVANGQVFTYAQICVPMDGIKPFDAAFLLRWGYVVEMPEDLRAKVEAAIKDPKYAEAKKVPAQQDAYIKEFTDKLDPAQAKQFGEAIANRFNFSHWWTMENLTWMASFKDKEIKTRQEFMNLFIDKFHHTIYHGPNAAQIIKHADALYKEQTWADAIYCLDEATGKLLWSKEFPGTKKSWGVEFGCSGLPTVVKDRLYFAGSGGVYCLNLAKQGELVWQGKGAASHSSPLVADGVVYCCPGELAAFNAETGAELWRQPAAISEYASPVLWKHAGKSYVICGSSAPRYQYSIFCVDAQTGKIAWKEKAVGDFPTPVLVGDTMVVRTNGGCAAYGITPEKAEKLWVSKDGGDYGGGPIVYMDHIYGCGQAYTPNLLTVLDLKTGATVQKYNKKGGQCTHAVLADGKIIFISESGYKIGRLICFNAVPDKYEEVGQLPAPDVVACTSPAFANGKVYVRMPKAIACYDLADHAK
ncbi:MAG: PQQ-binding-like beta-propeller repeat protein [Planctomycetota bacterium]|nr:PQQ-binding-like beta-propeller repeat protein [Planctomycetota bacterium]